MADPGCRIWGPAALFFPCLRFWEGKGWKTGCGRGGGCALQVGDCCCLSFMVPTRSVCGRDSGARWRAGPTPEPESPRTPFIFPFFFLPSATPLTAPLSPPLTPVQRHPLPSQPTNLGGPTAAPSLPPNSRGHLPVPKKGSGQPLRAPLRGGGGPGAARHEAAPPRPAPPRPRSAARPEPPLGTCGGLHAANSPPGWPGAGRGRRPRARRNSSRLQAPPAAGTWTESPGKAGKSCELTASPPRRPRPQAPRVPIAPRSCRSWAKRGEGG